MADIGNLPSPGTKPWNLNPAISAMNDELNGLTTLTTSGRLSEEGLSEEIAGAVTPLVTEAIASDGTIIAAVEDAAGTAVAAELNGNPRLPGVATIEGVSVVIADANGNHTFLAANDSDGAPTAHAARLIGSTLSLEELTELPLEEADTPGISIALIATSDRMTFLTANDVDGGPTPHASSLIATYVRPLLNIPDVPEDVLHPKTYLAEQSGGNVFVLDLSTGQRRQLTTGLTVTDTPQVVGESVVFTTPEGRKYVPVGGGTPGLIYPTTAIVCRGDSHVNGAAGNGTNINTVLAATLGVSVTNDGHGGWGSSDVALNAGAISVSITVQGDQIPASGPVTITARTPPMGWRTFGGATVITIPGVLHAPSGDLAGSFVFDAAARTHSFVRATSGAVVACPPGTRFTSGNGHRTETQVIWCGSNDVPYGADAEAVYGAFLANVAAMVQAQSALAKRTIVLSLPTGASDYTGTAAYVRRTTANQRLAAIYGDTYIDVRRYLIDHGLADAGITPTADDTYSIARDTIPPSLLASDRTHLLAPGLTIVGNLIAARMRSLGWYPTT